MKKVLLFAFLCIISFVGFAQNEHLLQWKIEYKQTAPQLYSITASTTIPNGWHLYGNNASVEGLTSVQFITADFENDELQGEPTFNKPATVITDPFFENQQVNIYTGAITVIQEVKIEGIIPAKLKGVIEAFIAKGDEFVPASFAFEVSLEGGVAATAEAQNLLLPSIDLEKPIAQCGNAEFVESTGFLKVFLLGILGGLIALLTPCVFPMIPVTVSFFTKRSPNHKAAVKNGILYGGFIFLIYVAASIPFHLLNNVQPEIFNNISTNAWLNILFFAIFLFFAISFFGYFEITLPSGIAGKADSKSSLGSIGGIFFMALTLTIVSFSCTGPILGSLLVGTAGGGAWHLTAGLAGFGIALALPFALFAVFPNWLNSLPKSGGWLDTVKKVLAFLELAFAIKFLSNADLVMHWGLLKREVFIALWLLIGIGLVLYLFGFLRLPYDNKNAKLSMGRKIAGVIALVFTLYLIPGLTNTNYANLKLLSGFPPPMHYSIYGKESAAHKGLEANVVNDYNKAVQLAKEQNKPLLIDFTGWACVNCRKMEENVWTVPEVKEYIQQNFILLSLYVDDKQKLPVTERFTYKTKKGFEKDIVTIGDKWATFQTENFGQATQPLYVILDNEERLLNHSIGYTPDVKKYLEWLQCGKNAFKEN
ncbi:MAG: thioredoxin family protein [Chitinophagaceae bacterium]|nr:thioredoxin family protein [Chitinophagaceae bacterium]MCW5905705.1 thioredoxin family protein [Chitinophagaceae bacterium]